MEGREYSGKEFRLKWHQWIWLVDRWKKHWGFQEALGELRHRESGHTKELPAIAVSVNRRFFGWYAECTSRGLHNSVDCTASIWQSFELHRIRKNSFCQIRWNFQISPARFGHSKLSFQRHEFDFFWRADHIRRVEETFLLIITRAGQKISVGKWRSFPLKSGFHEFHPQVSAECPQLPARRPASPAQNPSVVAINSSPSANGACPGTWIACIRSQRDVGEIL